MRSVTSGWSGPSCPLKTDRNFNVDEMFKSHKFDVTYNEAGGAHSCDKWREYLHEFAPKLFQ